MKSSIIFIAALIFVIFPIPTTGSAGDAEITTHISPSVHSQPETTFPNGFPPIINIAENANGIIHIPRPSDYQVFEIAEIADINKDGFDDIIIDCSRSVSYMIDFVYVLYGSPSMESTIDIDNTKLRKSKIVWDLYESNGIYLPMNSETRPLITGDINGDGVPDLIFTAYMLNENQQLNSLQRFIAFPGQVRLPEESFISERIQDMIKIFAIDSTYPHNSPSPYAAKDSYFCRDMNGDGIDDLILNYESSSVSGVPKIGKLYIVYGGRNLPSEINAENSTWNCTKIIGDTLYFGNFLHVAAGDVDNDGKLDLLMEGGLNRMQIILPSQWVEKKYHYGISYLIYNSVFEMPQFVGSGLNLTEKVIGLTSLISDPYDDYFEKNKMTMDDIIHKVSIGDINGDGYDDVIIGYTNSSDLRKSKDDNYGYSKIYILPGKQNFILSGNIDQMTHDIIKIQSAYRADFMGTDFAFGDVNGDGYNDCLIADAKNSFYVLYGRKAFPDSFQIEENFSLGSTVHGGSFFETGDLNNDGYADIIGSDIDGIFIIPGRGETYAQGTTYLKELSQSAQTHYSFSFSDGSGFHFKFTKGIPSSNSQLQLTNLGRHLPDSLKTIPSPQKVVSFVQADFKNMNSLSAYRISCSFDYTDSSLDAAGINETDLMVATWNEQNSKWEKLQTTIDTTMNRAAFEVEHFSLFALIDKNDSIMTGVKNAPAQNPSTFELFQNYPNPFNPFTIIRFSIERLADCQIRIYNILGQEVKTIINKKLSAGSYEVQWDGTDNFGHRSASGIYIYRLETSAGYMKTKKMVFFK